MADLLKLWPVEQKKNLTSTKWAERKDSLQSLLKIIETTPSIAFQRSYAEIFDDLKKIIRTDSNVNVVSEAVKVVTAVAEQFPIEFKTFVPGLAPVCFEKFKEKKAVLREPLTKCVDVLIDICGINKLGNAFQEAWQKPNNDVKAQLALAIFNNLNTIRQNDPTPMEFIKQVMPALIKFTTDADPKVRDATLHALAAVQRLYGKDVLSSLVGASVRDDNAKMAKIDTYAEKAAEEAEKAAQLRGATCAAADDSEDSGTVADSAECENAPSVSTIDPWELLTPVDVVALLPSNFYEEIVSKKWTERRDVLEVLVKLLDEHKRLDPSPRHYHDLMSSLKKIVEKDVNINVVILAVKALDGLAQGLRDAFEPFASVCGAVLAKLKEKKAIVRDPLFEFLKTLFTWVQLEKCGELIQTALSSPNPNVRKETCLFLKEYFCKHNATTFNYDITAEFRDNLLKAVDDSDGSVRDAAMEAIGALTRCVGLPFAEKKIFHVFGNDAIKLKKITDYHATYMTDFGTNADPRIVKLYKSNAKAAKPRPSPAVSTAPKRTVPSSAGTVRKSTPPSTAPIRRPVPAPVPVRKPAPTPSAPTRRAPPNVNTSARPASSVQRTMPSTPKAPVVAARRVQPSVNVTASRAAQPRPTATPTAPRVALTTRATPSRPIRTSTPSTTIRKPNSAAPNVVRTNVTAVQAQQARAGTPNAVAFKKPLVPSALNRARTHDNLRPQIGASKIAQPTASAASSRPQTGSSIPMPRSFRPAVGRSSSSAALNQGNGIGNQ